MKEYEKKICNDILRYGTIISDKEFTCEGDMVRQYEIGYEGVTYLLIKVNGEWEYIHSVIE